MVRARGSTGMVRARGSTGMVRARGSTGMVRTLSKSKIAPGWGFYVHGCLT